MGDKKRINFNVDEELFYDIKKLVAEKKTTMTELFTEFAMQEIEKEKTQKKLDDF